MTYALVKKTTG